MLGMLVIVVCYIDQCLLGVGERVVESLHFRPGEVQFVECFLDDVVCFVSVVAD